MGLKIGLSHQSKYINWGCSENRALKKMLEPTWEEVTVGWRKVHNEELPYL
jgi:hypothetical protein